eukprot:scaffold7080_cov38-Prasinocladus_malaysianus.AAC.1
MRLSATLFGENIGNGMMSDHQTKGNCVGSDSLQQYKGRNTSDLVPYLAAGELLLDLLAAGLQEKLELRA